MGAPIPAGLVSAGRVDQPATGGGQQPRLGLAGTPCAASPPEPREGLGQGVLGLGHIAGTGGDERDQPSVAGRATASAIWFVSLKSVSQGEQGA